MHLLGRDVIGGSPHVNLLVDIEAGDDEEDAGSSGSTREKTTQPEDDRSLVLLQSAIIVGLWTDLIVPVTSQCWTGKKMLDEDNLDVKENTHLYDLDNKEE